MANGRPGDHPLTDMLSYGWASGFPSDILAAVKELAAHPGFAAVRDEVASVLWNDWPNWQNVTPDFDKVRGRLGAIRQAMADDPGKRPAG